MVSAAEECIREQSLPSITFAPRVAIRACLIKILQKYEPSVFASAGFALVRVMHRARVKIVPYLVRLDSKGTKQGCTSAVARHSVRQSGVRTAHRIIFGQSGIVHKQHIKQQITKAMHFGW